MMRRSPVLPAILLLALLFLLSPSPASADAAAVIGCVKNASGAAAVVRGLESIPARPGLRLVEGDAIETGPDGAVGAIMRDDAVISVGPSSRVALDRFLYAPAEGKLGFTARIVRGTFSYLSGLIGRLAPESTRFETPVATVGIRGTRFAIRVAE
jgi:hypothetical protein